MWQQLSNTMQLYTVYLYLQTALHVSSGYFHPTSAAHVTVSTVYDINDTVDTVL